LPVFVTQNSFQRFDLLLGDCLAFAQGSVALAEGIVFFFELKPQADQFSLGQFLDLSGMLRLAHGGIAGAVSQRFEFMEESPKQICLRI
jgi:hypothetical protein